MSPNTAIILLSCLAFVFLSLFVLLSFRTCVRKAIDKHLIGMQREVVDAMRVSDVGSEQQIEVIKAMHDYIAKTHEQCSNCK